MTAVLRFDVPVPARVGFFSGESGKFTLAETARRIATAAGCDLAGLGDSLVVSTTLPRLDEAQDLQQLEQFIERDGLNCVIIDPAYLAFRALAEKANNVFSMGNLLAPVAQLCRRLSVTLILAHHSRKGRAKGEPLELEDLAYTGWSQFARQWLLVSRREPYIEGAGGHKLWLHAGGSAGHSGLYGVDVFEGRTDEPRVWDVCVLSAAEASQQQATLAAPSESLRDEELERLLAAIRQFPEGESLSVIRSAAGMRYEKARAGIETLCARGAVVSCPVHKPDRKTSRTGWRLA